MHIVSQDVEEKEEVRIDIDALAEDASLNQLSDDNSETSCYENDKNHAKYNGSSTELKDQQEMISLKKQVRLN